MIRAYLFALDPTGAQAEMFRSHCGAQRYAYNFGLALVRANLDQRAAERSYGVTGDQLTPPVSWSAYGLRKIWNEAKDERAPWWAVNSKEAYSSGLASLAAALSDWSASASGKRAGRKVAFPRFKSRRSPLTCRFTTGAFGLGEDRRHIRLPRIGLVRTHEPTRKLARRVDNGTARIRSVTLSWQRGRWHVSFSVELPDPRHLDATLTVLRRAQRRCSRRRGPDRRTRTVASNRWRKATARVAALHTRVANARRDGLHK
ncbi:MAG: helix-turn-helix domain-containing protein, partial [Pseudonocardiaceae bacterium]